MRSIQFAVNPENGDVVVTITSDGMHVCADFDGEEFDGIVEMMTGAHLDSKMARS